jgi:hypothetical protein
MNLREKINEILLLEDNATTAERRSLPGVGTGEAAATVTVRVHKLSGNRNTVVAHATYEAGSMRSKNGARIELVAQLLRRAVARSVKPIIVAGTSYGSAAPFLAMLCDDALPFVVQIANCMFHNQGYQKPRCLQVDPALVLVVQRAAKRNASVISRKSLA